MENSYWTCDEKIYSYISSKIILLSGSLDGIVAVETNGILGPGFFRVEVHILHYKTWSKCEVNKKLMGIPLPLDGIVS